MKIRSKWLFLKFAVALCIVCVALWIFFRADIPKASREERIYRVNTVCTAAEIGQNSVIGYAAPTGIEELAKAVKNTKKRHIVVDNPRSFNPESVKDSYDPGRQLENGEFEHEVYVTDYPPKEECKTFVFRLRKIDGRWRVTQITQR